MDVQSWANSTNVGDVPACKAALSEVISKYAESRKKPEGFVAAAEAQMSAFCNKQGYFSSQAVINKGKVLLSHVFFDTQGATIPEFAEVAKHLSSKGCGSGASERDHKDTKLIWTKGRNRLEEAKIEKLKHRYSSLRMRRGVYEADEVDPKIEMALYTEKEDYVDPLEALLPRAGGINEDIRANTFLLYQEDWEDFTVDEKSDATMRFRLVNKYKGIYLHDRSDEYDDYRVIVDLEWSQQKVKDYGNKKGWVLVCELMSPYHDVAIAEAGEDKDTIREAYIINKELFACVKAAPALHQTRPLKTRAQVTAEGAQGGGGGGGAGGAAMAE